MKNRLLCGIAFLTAFSSSAAQFTFGNQVLTVPDGYEVERIVEPTLASRPISAAFDEQGRMYVTVSSGDSSNANEQIKNPSHTIVRLEDTDGDGRFDKKTMFAEKVMFPEGCMWLNGSLYVSAVPQILKFTDTDGDGVSDKREIWHDGKTVNGCANDLHGPYLGRDGWIYWCKGAWGQQTYDRPGKKPLVTRAAHIFRARPDGTGAEPVLTGGMDNPVGVAFAANGERFLSCTFYEPGGGKRDGLIHAIYGGVYGKPHESINEHKQTGDLMPGLTHAGAAAPCGLICYDSKGLGDGFSGNLFACYFNLHKVSRHELVPNGATYTTRDTDFIASTHVDFHPTDVLEDADGSLIVVDTGGWYKVCCPTSQIAKPDVFGAVYRIRKVGAPKIEDPRGLKIDWPKQTSAELAGLLLDARLYVRRRATNELIRKGAEAVGVLKSLLGGNSTPETRTNAIWTLAQLNNPEARAAIRQALNDGDPAAIHAAGLWRDSAATDALLKFIDADNPDRQRAAAEALGRIGDKRAVPALLAAVGRLKVTDMSSNGSPLNEALRIQEHSLLYALIEIGAPAETLEGLSSPNPRTQRAALIALDQMDDSTLGAEKVAPLLSSPEPVLKRTAAWIVGRRPDWGAALADHFRKRIANLPKATEERTQLISELARLAKSPPIQELLVASVEIGGDSAEVALAAIAGAGLRSAPAIWVEMLARKLKANDARLFPHLISAAESLPLTKDGYPELSAVLYTVARNTDLRPELRLRAVNAVGRPSALDEPTLALLLAHIASSKPPVERSLASTALAKAELSPAQQTALAGALKQVSPLDLPLLLPAFSRGGDETSGLKLVAALESSAGVRSLQPAALKANFSKYPKGVQEAGTALIESLAADNAKQASRLEELLPKMKDGNAERGKVVYSTKGTCITCHTKESIGVNFGPDLTTVNKVRSERDLLEAIIFPSASFVRGFEPFTVITNSGEAITGLVRKDSPDEVVIGVNAQTEKRIARTEIKRMRADSLSVMPQGFDQILTTEELADLIAFLKSK